MKRLMIIGIAVFGIGSGIVYGGSNTTGNDTQRILNYVYEDSDNGQVVASTNVANGGFLWFNEGGGMKGRNVMATVNISSAAFTQLSPTDTALNYTVFWTTYTTYSVVAGTASTSVDTDTVILPTGNAPMTWLNNRGLWLKIEAGGSPGTAIYAIRTYKY